MASYTKFATALRLQNRFDFYKSILLPYKIRYSVAFGKNEPRGEVDPRSA